MRNDPHGFTLIEIIAAIMVSAVLAVVIVQIVSGYTQRSYWPLQKINENLALQETMENISADYRNLLMTNATPLVTLQQRISDGDYFNTSIPIAPTLKFIVIEPDILSANTDPTQTCNDTDLILKVTLQIEGTQHKLTALFTR
jgi:prepilin-type N-terminal cleavage/methylation domain-containing protein